jgi:hypothetical protein
MRSEYTPMISDAEWPIYSLRLKRPAEVAERGWSFDWMSPRG